MKLILENWNEFLNEQNFDTATGAPISDKGRELCAKNPQCKAKHMSDAAPAQSGEDRLAKAKADSAKYRQKVDTDVASARAASDKDYAQRLAQHNKDEDEKDRQAAARGEEETVAHRQKMAQFQQASDKKLAQQKQQNDAKLAKRAELIAQLKKNPNMTPEEIMAALNKPRTAEE